MEYKDVLLTELFDISTTKSVDKNKIKMKDNAPYDFIGRTSINYGIQGHIDKLDFEPNPKDTFSLVQVGESIALWREKEWYASQNIFILNPKFNEIKDVFLYFQTVINKTMSMYGKTYNFYPTIKSLSKTYIKLPITEIGYIDFEYMKFRIAELESERISEIEQERNTELEQYLLKSGLDTYELTEEEKKIIESFETKEMREFRVGNLFDIHPTKQYDKFYNFQLYKNIGDTPVLSNSSVNNGIGGYSNLEPTEKAELLHLVIQQLVQIQCFINQMILLVMRIYKVCILLIKIIGQKIHCYISLV